MARHTSPSMTWGCVKAVTSFTRGGQAGYELGNVMRKCTHTGWRGWLCRSHASVHEYNDKRNNTRNGQTVQPRHKPPSSTQWPLSFMTARGFAHLIRQHHIHMPVKQVVVERLRCDSPKPLRTDLRQVMAQSPYGKPPWYSAACVSLGCGTRSPPGCWCHCRTGPASRTV